MFERYSESARRALFFARYEVSELGAMQIEPEHLLLGLLREPTGVMRDILSAADVSVSDLRKDVEREAAARETAAREKTPTSVEIPFTAQAQAVLLAAAGEADRLEHNYIATEHLLLGLLCVEDSRAAAILARHGLTLARAREQVKRASAGAPHRAGNGESSAVEQAINLYSRLLETWNQRDAASFTALFAATGTAIGFDGSQMTGRGEIESTLRGIFASHQTASYVAKVREVRPLGAHAALLRAVAGMVPPGAHEINPAVNAVQTVVLVEEGGGVSIALLQNTPAAFHGHPELVRQLTDELSAVARAGRVVDPP